MAGGGTSSPGSRSAVPGTLSNKSTRSSPPQRRSWTKRVPALAGAGRSPSRADTVGALAFCSLSDLLSDVLFLMHRTCRAESSPRRTARALMRGCTANWGPYLHRRERGDRLPRRQGRGNARPARRAVLHAPEEVHHVRGARAGRRPRRRRPSGRPPGLVGCPSGPTDTGCAGSSSSGAGPRAPARSRGKGGARVAHESRTRT